MDDLRAKLTDKVKFVSLAHASNVLGVVNPIKEITQMAHEVGAIGCCSISWSLIPNSLKNC